MAIGRISGAMLKANLERLGTDIAFETDLLYIDVVNDRIGINTNSPTKSLQVDNITLEGRSIRAVGGDLDLGAVGDITITGGGSDQVLKTDGSGNLSWTSVAGGGLVTGRDVTLSWPDDSTLYPTGAISNWADTTNVSTAIDDLNELSNNIINNTAVSNVDFTADVTSGGAGLTVTLTISADGNPTRYDINWGTGESATSNTTDSTPSHTYSSNTNSPFTITVTAKHHQGVGSGSSVSKTRASYIVIYTATPVPAFAAYAASSGGSPITQWDDGATVYFQNNTTNTSGATIQYTWDWGDSESDNVISSDSVAGGVGGGRLSHTFTASSEQERTRTVELTLDSHTTALPSDIPADTSTAHKIYDTHTPTVSLSSTSGINEAGTSGHPITFTNNTENTIGSYSTYGIQYRYTWGDGQTSTVNTGSGAAGDTGGTIGHTYTLTNAQQNAGTDVDYTGKLEVLSDHSSSPFATSNFTVHVEPDMRASATGTAVTTSDGSGDNQYDIYDYTDIDGTNRALVTVTNAVSPTVSSPAASYTFNWADGSANDTPTENGSSAGTVGNAITHNYAGKSAGNYNLNLSVSATPDITAQSDSYTGITFQMNSIPSAPSNLSSKSLTLNDSYQGTSPKLCHGFTDNTSSFTSQSPGDSLSTTTSRRYTSTTTIDTNTVSNFITNHYNGTNQTITSKYNNVAGGSRAVTTSEGGSNNSTFTTLVLTNHRDYDQVVSSYPQRAYLVATAKQTLNLTGYALGSSAQRIESSAGGNTNVVHVVKDDLTTTPTTSIGTVVGGIDGVYRYISGVPYYNSGSPSVNITGTTITNLTGQAYRDTSSPHEVDPATNDESTSGSVISNNNYTYSDMDGSTTFLNSGTPLVNTGVGGAYTLGTIAVPITGSSVRSVQTIKARTKNVNGQGSYSTGSTKIQVHTASPNGVVEDAIPVDDSLGNGSTHTDDGKRITGFGAASDTPSFTGSTNYYTANAWSGSVTVAGTSEAITRWGTIKHYTTDLSSGYLPAGPDLATGRSGAQYYTFAFRRTPAANFKFKFSGKLSKVWIAAPGSAIDSASGLSGWLDATQTYAGSGVPGSDTGNGGNGSNGCAQTSGDRIPTGSTVSNDSSTLTLGSENMANTTGNTILVRIKLVSGDSITALEIEDA
jgi:hypothetical protein